MSQIVPSFEPYISLEETADRLGYSTRWVRDRVRFDGLPTHQRGRGAKHRFRWSEVEAWNAREGSVLHEAMSGRA